MQTVVIWYCVGNTDKKGSVHAQYSQNHRRPNYTGQVRGVAFVPNNFYTRLVGSVCVESWLCFSVTQQCAAYSKSLFTALVIAFHDALTNLLSLLGK
jgi:hypothetical protein